MNISVNETAHIEDLKLEVFLGKCDDHDEDYICPGYHWVVLACLVKNNGESFWYNYACGIENSPEKAFAAGMKQVSDRNPTLEF